MPESNKPGNPLHQRVIIDGDEFPEHLLECSALKITQGDLTMAGRRKKYHVPDGVLEYHPFEITWHYSKELAAKIKALRGRTFKLVIIDEDGLGNVVDRQTIPDCEWFDTEKTPGNAESVPTNKIKIKVAGYVPVETKTM